MQKYSLCIEPILEKYDFYDRIKVAADLGLDAIEFWDTEDKDISKISKLAIQNNLDVAICCLKGAWNNRLNLSSDAVVKNVSESIEIIKDLGCNSLIGLSGDIDEKGDMQKEIIIENLKQIADILENNNVTLNLESLNSIVDHEGYFLDSSKKGFDIIKNVDCPNIKLLYDIYHMQIMEGNLTENIRNNINFIGHFHSAGVPGRNEHFIGEINYPSIIKTIENSEYKMFFGLEYWPTYDDLESISDVIKTLKSQNKKINCKSD